MGIRTSIFILGAETVENINLFLKPSEHRKGNWIYFVNLPRPSAIPDVSPFVKLVLTVILRRTGNLGKSRLGGGRDRSSPSVVSP